MREGNVFGASWRLELMGKRRRRSWECDACFHRNTVEATPVSTLGRMSVLAWGPTGALVV